MTSLPVFKSLAGYQRPWLSSDFVAGLTVWAVLVPEALAYASIAGVSSGSRATGSTTPPSSADTLEVSATDSYPSATDEAERSLRIVAHQRVSLLGIRRGEEVPCDTLECCLAVSRWLLDQAPDWHPRDQPLP